VNLVGGFAADQPVADTPVEVFEAQFRLNLRPTYLVTQAALPALVAAGGGAVVCVSSRSALHPFAGAAGYCASKAAVITFVQVVAREHAGDGVRCNAVMPSMIDTPANRAAMPPERHGDLTPPEDIAAVIRFLCSDESRPTTGAAIPVYGGP
jgi:NAD(P)-dependent dehydrogenase (short-subunit alcohol dehydrogenase family)